MRCVKILVLLDICTYLSFFFFQIENHSFQILINCYKQLSFVTKCLRPFLNLLFRLCREKHLTEACVQLSALLGLWEAAVDLALTVNLDLAKATASQPNLSDEQRRMLWLKIGRYLSFFLHFS